MRERFSRILARDEIYLANHSLGRPLDQMEADVREGLAAWYDQMDGAWGPWFDEIARFRKNLANLVGVADPRRVVPKSTVGQGLRAVLNAMIGDRPLRVVATRGEFDSVDFILKVYQEKGFVEVVWIEPSRDHYGLAWYDFDDMAKALNQPADLVILSIVAFGTGQILSGMAELVKLAQSNGARVFLDGYHAVGVIPVAFDQIGADFLAGGCYKYLRGGTGACWLAMSESAMKMETLDTGWFAKREPFSYHRPEHPERDDAWMESTPSILPLYQARSGLEFTLEIGLETIRQTALRQRRLLAELIPQIHPGPIEETGGFSVLVHQEANRICQALRERKVVTDARGSALRFGPDILTADEELVEAARVLHEIL